MMMIRVRAVRLIGVACFLAIAGTARATTWNEPWHEEVMQASDSFVKLRIIEIVESGCRAEVLKLLGGEAVPVQIQLAGFSKLSLTSMSSGSDELRLPFRADQVYYVFLKKNPRTNAYQIPTPTAGWARVNQGIVAGTYRHSYHQALVPEDIYEQTMQAIFKGFKRQPYDKAFVTKFVKDQLSA